MPTRPEGVYQDGRGGWYLKLNVGRDPLPASGRANWSSRRSPVASTTRFLSRMPAVVHQGPQTAEAHRPRPSTYQCDPHACQRGATEVAAERLGHADPTLFTNLYSHVTPTMQHEAAERIGTLLFGEELSARHSSAMYGAFRPVCFFLQIGRRKSAIVNPPEDVIWIEPN